MKKLVKLIMKIAENRKKDDRTIERKNEEKRVIKKNYEVTRKKSK